MPDPFEQATQDINHVPKVVAEVVAAGAVEKTTEQIATELAAASLPAGAVTPDSIFGEEYKDKPWDEVKTAFQTATQKGIDLEKEVTELKARKPTFADPEIEQYNAWVENGGAKDFGLFSKIKSVDGNALDDIDAIVTKRVIENPEYKGLESQLKAQLVNEFKLESTVDAPLTDDEIKLNRAAIAVQGKQAKEYLTGLKGKMTVVVADPAILEQSRKDAFTKHVQSWTPTIDKVFTEIKTIPLQIVKKDAAGKNVKDAQGQDVFEKFDEYPIPEHLQKKYKDLFAAEVAHFPVFDAESESKLKSSFVNRFLIDNEPYLLAYALDKQRTDLEKAYDKKYGGGLTPKDPGGAGKGNSSSDEVFKSFTQTINA